MATPDTVRYSTNPTEAVSAESELVIFRSELADYNPSSNKFIRINLPVADKGFVDWSDSVISMDFTNRSHNSSSGNATHSGAKTQMNNLIKSVTILNSQNEQVEYINNYNLISNLMDDYSYGPEHKKSVEQILNGGSTDGNPANATAIAGTASTSEADGGSLTMVDRLMTGFTSGSFLVPLGFSIGQAPSILIELETPATALALTGNGGNFANLVAAYKVSNVQLRAKVVKFSDGFNQSFEQTLAEAGSVGINYISESFLHNQNTINANAVGSVNVPFSSNPRSAKYIMATHRIEGDVQSLEKFSLGLRKSANLDEYSFEIGGRLYPTQPIPLSATNYSQAYANVLDSLGVIGAINHNTMITKDTTNTEFYHATDDCKYVSALTLEDFNSATNPSIYSGANLSTMGVMNYRPKIASAINSTYRVDIFTSIDVSYHFTIDGRFYSVR